MGPAFDSRLTHCFFPVMADIFVFASMMGLSSVEKSKFRILQLWASDVTPQWTNLELMGEKFDRYAM